jgi:hypothetical protein
MVIAVSQETMDARHRVDATDVLQNPFRVFSGEGFRLCESLFLQTHERCDQRKVVGNAMIGFRRIRIIEKF